MAIVDIDRLVEHFGGPMSASEIKYLGQIRNFLGPFIERKVGIDRVVDSLVIDIKNLVSCKLDVEEAFGEERLPSMMDPETAISESDSQMTSEELEFLQDVDGWLNFVVRNGLVFNTALEVLSHDFREIRREGSLENALKTGFLPKATGWSKVTEDSVGQPEEPLEDEW